MTSSGRPSVPTRAAGSRPSLGVGRADPDAEVERRRRRCTGGQPSTNSIVARWRWKRAQDRRARRRNRERGADGDEHRCEATTSARAAGGPSTQARTDGRREVALVREVDVGGERAELALGHARPPPARPAALERPGEPRLDRPGADAERSRGLGLGEVEEVAAGDRLTVVLRQPVERGDELLAPLGAEQGRLRGGGRLPGANGWPCAARSASAAGAGRRERRRLRASFATIRSSHGLNGGRAGSARAPGTPSRTRPGPPPRRRRRSRRRGRRFAARCPGMRAPAPRRRRRRPAWRGRRARIRRVAGPPLRLLHPRTRGGSRQLLVMLTTAHWPPCGGPPRWGLVRGPPSSFVQPWT